MANSNTRQLKNSNNSPRSSSTPHVPTPVSFAAGPTRRIVTVTPRLEQRPSGPVIAIPQDAGYSEWEEPATAR